jgi:peptide/nickel transport system permease protein
MTAYLIRRLWQMIPTLMGVILFVFVIFNMVGGDPAYVLAGKISSPEQIANIRKQLGVDEPYYVQLWLFVQQVVTGNYGASWSTSEQVSNMLITRVPPSLMLAIPIIILDAILALLIAMAVAYVRASLTDRALMVICTVAQSISILVYIILGQYFFAFQLGWFKVQGWGDSFWINMVSYAALPILIAVAVSLAPSIRLYRTFILDEINQDYVRTARAKGMTENRIMLVHVLRNAAIPIITYILVALPGTIVGLFVTERYFSIPGIGREVILAVERSDFPVIKAITIYVAILTMFMNLAADLLYKAVDPRVELK